MLYFQASPVLTSSVIISKVQVPYPLNSITFALQQWLFYTLWVNQMVLSTYSWWKKKLKTDGCGSQQAAVWKHGTKYINSPSLFFDISKCLNMHIHIFFSLQPCNLLSPHFLVHPNLGWTSCLLFFFTSLIFTLSIPSVLLQDFNCWPHALFSAFPFLLPGFLCVLSAILSLSCWSPLLSTVL